MQMVTPRRDGGRGAPGRASAIHLEMAEPCSSRSAASTSRTACGRGRGVAPDRAHRPPRARPRGSTPTTGALEVVTSRPHQHRWIVRLAGVDDREAAEARRGTVLRAEPEADDDPDAIWVHEVVGRRVVDQDGVDRGEVQALQANPASDLLVLDTGALVPLRFVVDHADPAVVRVDVPEGLFDPS
ncbi:MAG: hypothetical protein R2726_02295 [Acidimicrobiales bacterium]